MGQLQERKLTIRVEAGSIRLTIPATSLTSDAIEADKVTLYIETISNASLRTDLQKVLNSNTDYLSTDIVYTLRMVAVKAGQEIPIERLGGPVKVERKLAPEQLNWDYRITSYNVCYTKLLRSADLIGRSYIEYYFVVSDGTNETKSSTVRVNVVGGPDHSPLRLNVKDGRNNFV